MDNRDDEEIQPYQFEPEWSPRELDTPEYSDNDTDTSDSSSDLEFGGVEPQGWRLIAASNIHLIRNYETFHARMLSADVIQAVSSI